MQTKVELFTGTYKNYADNLYKEIRQETYGEDIGQTSWLTANEYRDFFSILKLSPGKKVLEIASGSGGPAVFMVSETGCDLTGIDINDDGVKNSIKLAEQNGLSNQMNFMQADCSKPLPFPNETFDAIVSIDSMNHLLERGKVLREFRRVLKKGGRLLYTDPVVITGCVTNEELAIRSSLGLFLFTILNENERLLTEASFQEIQSHNVTDNIVMTSINWYNAREKRKNELLQIEEENNFMGIQEFLKMVHTLTSEKRLSRIMFSALK